MKILISPVGLSDPISDRREGEGPALTLCRYLEPDIVFLLPTAQRLDVEDSTYERGERTEELMRIILPDAAVYIKPLDVSDSSDFSQILPQLKIVITSILEQTQNYPEPEFYINATSATPQIQAACLLAVSSGLLSAKALQVADPRYAPQGKRVREVPVTLLQEEEQIDKVSRLFQRYLFEACIEELNSLERLTSSRQRRDAAENWCLLCQAYATLDRLDYEDSYGQMSSLIGRIVDTYEYRSATPLLKEQSSTLKQLKEGTAKENELVLTDLYHNAQRRFRQGNFADALARIWRVIEGGMFYRLRQYEIEPSDLTQSPNLQQAHKLEGAGRPQHMSLEASLAALKNDIQDEDFCNFLTEKRELSAGKRRKIQDWIEKLRDKRNKSVVAHGVETVETETARQGIELAQAFLLFLFPQLDLCQYPFSCERLDQVRNLIKKTM